MKRVLNKPKSSQVIGLFWDQLWRQLIANQQDALWDVTAAEAATLDYKVFHSTFDPSLPVLDIGCGSGIQSAYLASFYTRVIGIDASKKAIVHAKSKNTIENLNFAQINLLVQDEVQAFAAEVGSCNIYIRGVLHQIPYESRVIFVDHLKLLMGDSGSMYLIETAANIQSYITDLAKKFSDLPTSFKRVLTSHYPPLGVSKKELLAWFDNDTYDIVKIEDAVLHTKISLDKDKKIALPAIFTLVERIQTKPSQSTKF